MILSTKSVKTIPTTSTRRYGPASRTKKLIAKILNPYLNNLWSKTWEGQTSFLSSSILPKECEHLCWAEMTQYRPIGFETAAMRLRIWYLETIVLSVQSNWTRDWPITSLNDCIPRENKAKLTFVEGKYLESGGNFSFVVTRLPFSSCLSDHIWHT